MKLSSCCQSPPKTIVNEVELSFCSKCGNWVDFITYGEEDEQDDYVTLETEFRQFRGKVSAIVDFYGDPSNYIATVESDGSLIEMDKGKNARGLLTLMERDYENDDVDS